MSLKCWIFAVTDVVMLQARDVRVLASCQEARRIRVSLSPHPLLPSLLSLISFSLRDSEVGLLCSDIVGVCFVWSVRHWPSLRPAALRRMSRLLLRHLQVTL